MPSPKKRQLASITFHATGVPTSYSIAVAWRDGTGETLEFTPGGPALGAKGRKVGVGTEFPGTLEGFLFLLLMALQRERTPLAPHIGQPHIMALGGWGRSTWVSGVRRAISTWLGLPSTKSERNELAGGLLVLPLESVNDGRFQLCPTAHVLVELPAGDPLMIRVKAVLDQQEASPPPSREDRAQRGVDQEAEETRSAEETTGPARAAEPNELSEGVLENPGRIDIVEEVHDREGLEVEQASPPHEPRGLDAPAPGVTEATQAPAATDGAPGDGDAHAGDAREPEGIASSPTQAEAHDLTADRPTSNAGQATASVDRPVWAPSRRSTWRSPRLQTVVAIAVLTLLAIGLAVVISRVFHPLPMESMRVVDQARQVQPAQRHPVSVAVPRPVRPATSDVRRDRLPAEWTEEREVRALVASYERARDELRPFLPADAACIPGRSLLPMQCALLRHQLMRHVSAAYALIGHIEYVRSKLPTADKGIEPLERPTGARTKLGQFTHFSVEDLERWIEDAENLLLTNKMGSQQTWQAVTADRVTRASQPRDAHGRAALAARVEYLKRALIRLGWDQAPRDAGDQTPRRVSLFSTSDGPPQKRRWCWDDCKGGLGCGNNACSIDERLNWQCGAADYERYCGTFDRDIDTTAGTCDARCGDNAPCAQRCAGIRQ